MTFGLLAEALLTRYLIYPGKFTVIISSEIMPHSIHIFGALSIITTSLYTCHQFILQFVWFLLFTLLFFIHLQLCLAYCLTYPSIEGCFFVYFKAIIILLQYGLFLNLILPFPAVLISFLYFIKIFNNIHLKVPFWLFCYPYFLRYKLLRITD